MRNVKNIVLSAVLIGLVSACDTVLDDGAVPISPEYMDIELPDWGSDDRIVFSSWESTTANCDLWSCSGDGTALIRVTENEYVYESEPSWSPDGTKLVCVADNDDPSKEDGLYVCDTADGALAPLVTGGSYRYPKWSPDGSKIAYNRVPNYDLFTIDAEGGTPEKLTTEAVLVGWVANGEGLAYERGKGGYSVLVILYADSGEEKEVYVGTHYLTEAAISPDGEWVAYEYQHKDKPITDIFVANLKTKETRQVTYEKEPAVVMDVTGAFEPTWSLDGKWISFVSNRSNRHLYKIRVF
jgi:Tol biopolymer transport system component